MSWAVMLWSLNSLFQRRVGGQHFQGSRRRLQQTLLWCPLIWTWPKTPRRTSRRTCGTAPVTRSGFHWEGARIHGSMGRRSPLGVRPIWPREGYRGRGPRRESEAIAWLQFQSGDISRVLTGGSAHPPRGMHEPLSGDESASLNKLITVDYYFWERA